MVILQLSLSPISSNLLVRIRCDSWSRTHRTNHSSVKLTHVSGSAIDWKRYNEKCKPRCAERLNTRFELLNVGLTKKTVYRGVVKNENRLKAMLACADLCALAIDGRKDTAWRPPHNSIFGKSSLFQEKEQNSGNSLDIFLVEFDLAGDANGDGIVNAADTNIVMRWALGL